MSVNLLPRSLGLWGLIATGICSMLGASIYIVPFMIQRHVPGIGPDVIPAFLLAALPAMMAALAYASLSTAMPLAGGSYIYVSRGLNPYLGFIASFAQWFGLSIAIGVIAYVIIPFIKEITELLAFADLASWLDQGLTRVILALVLLWGFVLVNIKGTGVYQKTLIPLMILMFLLGILVIVIGFGSSPEEFLMALPEGQVTSHDQQNTLDGGLVIFSAAAVLFSSFIGFDSIAQAGSEAYKPRRNLPLAIGITVLGVATFYMLFTAAVYHAVPWQYVAQQAAQGDVSAPGLLRPVISPVLGALIILGAAVALINDLPAMLLSVSRLMFAWAEDSIFPKAISRIHIKYQTPHVALVGSGLMATLGILGSHFAGDFFLGVDIMVTSMMLNFILTCLTLITLSQVNPGLAAGISFIPKTAWRILIGAAGIITLLGFLMVHVIRDLQSSDAWYFKSTPVWLLVMLSASLVFWVKYYRLRNSGVDLKSHFSRLPDH